VRYPVGRIVGIVSRNDSKIGFGSCVQVCPIFIAKEWAHLFEISPGIQ